MHLSLFNPSHFLKKRPKMGPKLQNPPNIVKGKRRQEITSQGCFFCVSHYLSQITTYQSVRWKKTSKHILNTSVIRNIGYRLKNSRYAIPDSQSVIYLTECNTKQQNNHFNCHSSELFCNIFSNSQSRQKELCQ